MRRKVEGGCQCGAVRYSIEAEPKMIYACHCTICQRQSGSAFGMAVVFGDGKIEMAGIEPGTFERDGVGRKMRCIFCPRCGSRLYHQWFTEAGDIPFVSIKPGTFDDASWVIPDFHIWTQHKQPWIKFSADDVVYEQRMPAERSKPFFERAGEDT